MLAEAIIRIGLLLVAAFALAGVVMALASVVDARLFRARIEARRSAPTAQASPLPEPGSDPAWVPITHADVKLFLSQSTWDAITASYGCGDGLKTVPSTVVEGSSVELPDSVASATLTARRTRRACQECTSKCTPCRAELEGSA